MSKVCFSPTSGALLALLLSACATAPSEQGVPNVPSPGEAPRLTAKSQSSPETAGTGMDMTPAPKAPMILPGTGTFIDKKAAAKPVTATRTAPGEVTLNFDGADIRDVIKVIFDTLKESYTVDPQVQGEVTVQTSRPLAKDQLLPTLETLLRMNQAALVREGGLYRITPAANVVRQAGLRPRLGGGGVGYGVRIISLNYISATEMQAIIAPFLPEGGVLRADVARNLLIIAGTAQELASVQSTIDTFDVNWLKGMSIGMFRLRNVDSQSVASELNQLLGEGSNTPIAGLLRFVPLSKLNAVLVITPQVEYLKQVATWIERLDGIGGERLYVYAVQHSRADYMAELLNGLFNLGGGSAARGGEVAPGLKAGQLSGGAATTSGLSGTSSSGLGGGSSGLGGSSSGLGGGSSGSSSLSGGSTGSGLGSSRGTLTGGSTSSTGGRTGGRSGSVGGVIGALGSGGPSAGMEEVRIVADPDNNSLLIWATSQNYERILNTLERMDVPPRQVLIEATIAEVTLSGELKYGVQWFFNNRVGNGYTGNGSLGLSNDLTLTDALSGIANAGQFNYAITDSAGVVKALLNALATDSKVKVLSSPQVMVLDNQQASIRVGTQTPVPSPQTIYGGTTITTGGADYKDTGVLLEVLPRVNAGGMVNMEIKQEVVEPGQLVDVSQTGSVANKQRAFLQRNVASKVVVKSGQTLVLGGLIRENRTDGQSGFPILYKIPVLGALFGNTEQQVDRTELIVLLTPRVVQGSEEASQVTEEIKRKMQEVAPLVTPAG